MPSVTSSVLTSSSRLRCICSAVTAEPVAPIASVPSSVAVGWRATSAAAARLPAWRWMPSRPWTVSGGALSGAGGASVVATSSVASGAGPSAACSRMAASLPDARHAVKRHIPRA